MIGNSAGIATNTMPATQTLKTEFSSYSLELCTLAQDHLPVPCLSNGPLNSGGSDSLLKQQQRLISRGLNAEEAGSKGAGTELTTRQGLNSK